MSLSLPHLSSAVTSCNRPGLTMALLFAPQASPDGGEVYGSSRQSCSGAARRQRPCFEPIRACGVGGFKDAGHCLSDTGSAFVVTSGARSIAADYLFIAADGCRSCKSTHSVRCDRPLCAFSCPSRAARGRPVLADSGQPVAPENAGQILHESAGAHRMIHR
jgi:hypothetical protein